MDKLIRVTISVILALSFIIVPAFADDSAVPGFDDVPRGHWAEKSVHDLRALKITEGIGNNKFGMGLEVKRSEFVTYLTRLMEWELITP